MENTLEREEVVAEKYSVRIVLIIVPEITQWFWGITHWRKPRGYAEYAPGEWEFGLKFLGLGVIIGDYRVA